MLVVIELNDMGFLIGYKGIVNGIRQDKHQTRQQNYSQVVGVKGGEVGMKWE